MAHLTQQELDKEFKRYLGDSVYVTYDGFHLILTTDNGLPDDPRNRIALDPTVMANLVGYGRTLKDRVIAYKKREGMTHDEG